MGVGHPQLAHGDHVVTFYDDDEQLIDPLAAHFASCLTGGDAVVVIATDEHRVALGRALAARGIDIERAQAGGQLVMLDADTSLAQFLRGHGPDPDAFDDVVGSVVRAAGVTRSVHAFGEMVSLLWDRGDVTSAMDLERLWNKLAEKVGFSLVCGYRRGAFDDPSTADSFDRVCRIHTGLVGGAPDVESAEENRRLPCSKEAPRLARQFVADVLRKWGRRDLTDDAILIVGELATNAVVHAHSDMTVGVSPIGSGVRLMVTDGSPASPRRPDEMSVDAQSGRGLQLVEEIARHAGHFFVDSGKVSWAEVFPVGNSASA